MRKIAHPTQPSRGPLTGSVHLLARTPDYSVADMRCWLGPADPVRENEFPAFRVAAVVAGTFGLRSRLGSVTAVAGSLVIGNARECYCCRHLTAGGDRCINFDFEPQFLEGVRDSLGARGVGERFERAPVPASLDSVALTAVADAIANAGDRGALHEAALEMAAAGLTANQSVAEQGGRKISLGDERRIMRAARYVERHFDDACDLDSLAREAALSPFHFLRVFRRVTGQTPHRYVLATRLRHAARRLARTDERIAYVAAAVGFGDLSNFIAAFARAFGTSPRSYRARHA